MGVINKKWLDGTYRKTNGKHDGNNEDFGAPTSPTPKGYQFEYPTAHMVKLTGESFVTSGGSNVDFYHDKTNGISCRTVHCKDFKANDLGDGSTGYHIHICFFMGTPSADYMQDNRKNAAVTYTASEIDKKVIPASKKVYFKADCDDDGIVGVYSDDQCTKKKAEIKPYKFGGLDYSIIAENTKNGGKRVKFKTSDYGEVWATITTKAGQKLYGRDIK